MRIWSARLIVAVATMGMVGVGCTAAGPAPSAATAAFPEKGKPITIVVPWSAGSAADVGIRIVAPLMEKELGTPVQVLNKEGAGGQVAYTDVVQAKPDGYTLVMMGDPAVHAMYLDESKKAIFKGNSFELIGMQVDDPQTIAVLPSSPYKSMKEVLDAAKQQPLSFATSGQLNVQHLAGLLMEKLAGAKFRYVHTEGSTQVLNDFLGGHVDFWVGQLSQTPQRIKSGEIRALSILDTERSSFMPEVPTAEELGYKGLIMSAPRGIGAPAGTPKEAVTTLGDAMKKAVESDTHKTKMNETFLKVRYMDPAQYRKWWDEYEAQVRDLIALAKQSK